MNILIVPTVENGAPVGQNSIGGLLLEGLKDLGHAICGDQIEILAPRDGRFTLVGPKHQASGAGVFDLPALEALTHGSSYVLFFNPTFLLVEHPEYEALAQAATQGQPVVAGFPESGDWHAFACPPEFLRQHGDEVVPVIRRLGATLQDTSIDSRSTYHFKTVRSSSESPGCSPALATVDSPKGIPVFDSPVFLNSAMREAMASPYAVDPQKPLSVRDAFLALRTNSSVPWIFNALANEIELRTGEVQPLSMPQELHIAASGVCNLDCRFCDYTAELARQVFLSPEQFERLDLLSNITALRLASGIGEPTTNPDLPALIESARCGHPHLNINFCTNGLLLGSRLRESLLDFGLNWVSVSLNAASRATWAYLHGFDGFEEVIGNVRNLHQEKIRRGCLHPLVYASMVLTRTSVPDLPLMPRLCRELGIDRFTVFPFFGLVTNSPRKLGRVEAYYFDQEDYPKIFDKTVLEAEKHGVSLEIPEPSRQGKTSSDGGRSPLRDFARIERNSWRLGKLLNGDRFPAESHGHCPFLWRQANIGSVDRTHGDVPESHCLYPCPGPLSPLNFARVGCLTFSGADEFRSAWRNHLFALLREAQHSVGICQICDVCRNVDTRDPQFTPFLRRLVGDFARTFRLVREQPPMTAISNRALALQELGERPGFAPSQKKR